MSFPRYPEYKDSGVEWLGDVPGHWGVVQFKQFVDIQNGSDHKHVEQEDGYPVLGSGGVFAYASEFLYDGESVLLGRKGTIDKPLHISGRFWTVDTMYWTKISPFVSGRFTYYSALSIPFDFYSTNTALPSMTKGALSSHRVAFPPLPEQILIAAFLDRETAKIDGLVAEQRRLMELLKEKRQAVISHAVTRGMNPDVPMKPSGVEWLGDVPDHWDVSRLGYESWVRARLGWKGLKAEEYVEEGFAFLATPNIKGKEIDFEKVNFITQGRFDESPEIKISEGDVLLAKDGSTLGTVNVVRNLPRPTTVNSSIAVITPNTHLNGIFLFYLFASSYMEQTIQRTKGGMGVPHLFQADLNKFYIPLPALSEQAQIADYLDQESTKFETLVSEAQRAIDLLQERRTALISAAVTGQIDVRQTP